MSTAWNGGAAKRCGCGREHDAASWAGLRYVGELDDGVDVIELRDCPCGSSIAVLIGPSPMADTQPAPALEVA